MMQGHFKVPVEEKSTLLVKILSTVFVQKKFQQIARRNFCSRHPSDKPSIVGASGSAPLIICPMTYTVNQDASPPLIPGPGRSFQPLWLKLTMWPFTALSNFHIMTIEILI